MNQNSPKDESGVLKAVQNVHAMIDKEIAAGTDPNNVFVCGFSQGGLPFLIALQYEPPCHNPPNPGSPPTPPPKKKKIINGHRKILFTSLILYSAYNMKI